MGVARRARNDSGYKKFWLCAGEIPDPTIEVLVAWALISPGVCDLHQRPHKILSFMGLIVFVVVYLL
ncbi:hypothetical protein AAHA92_20394 [Salvia divinorum]|uniref:Uncharacterized protein n=1 Tax=Salvia divinorum TaxID=28513 RepID=A0ABD1GH18_SALDI